MIRQNKGEGMDKDWGRVKERRMEGKEMKMMERQNKNETTRRKIKE